MKQTESNSITPVGNNIFDLLWQPLTLMIIIAILQLLITLLSDGFVLSFDESIWHYVGSNWLRHGLAPYAGGVDNKSPFIFLLFGLSDLLFGTNYWFPRLIGTICELIGLYYLFKIANMMATRSAGMLVILIYGFSLLWHATGGKYVDFTETFEVMFLIMAIYYCLSATDFRDWLKTGLWAGLAFDFRITAAFGILAILLSGIGQGRTIRNHFTLLTGLLIGIMALLVFCYFTGIKPDDLWTYGFLNNWSSGSITDTSLAYKLGNFESRFLHGPIVIFYPLLLLYIYHQRCVDLPVWWCILSFLSVSLIGLFDVAHLKEILPGLSLTSAVALSRLSEHYRIRLFWMFLLVCIIFFPSLSEAINNIRILSGEKQSTLIYGKAPYINPSEGDRKLLAAWIKEHTRTTELVLVHSYGTQIQCYCERLSPSVYFSVDRTPLAKKRFFQDLNRQRPELILVPLFAQYQQWVDADQRNFVARLVRQYYFLDTTLYNYRIYRLGRHLSASNGSQPERLKTPPGAG